MPPLYTAHYLYIPVGTDQPIRDVDIPFGSTLSEQMEHIVRCRELLGGQARGHQLIYSGDLKAQLRGKTNVPRIGDEFTSYEALLRGDPRLPLNTRAAELLMTTESQPPHGPVLVTMTTFRHVAPNCDVKIGSGRPTEAHLRSKDFRKKRRRFKELMDENEVVGIVMAPAGVMAMSRN